MTWEAVNARARGLATHLQRRGTLDALARAPDLPTLAAELGRFGYAVEGGAGPAALDLAVRRHAAAELRIFARWCAGQPELVTVVFEDEDRRSLRALVRGAVQGATSDERLAGLIPTPALPERALEELGRQPTAAAVAALLVSWGHPYGRPLLLGARAAQPDLLHLDMRLNQTFAGRALAAGRRGGTALLAHVQELIDVENALAAVVLAGRTDDVTPKDLFLAGGRRLSIGDFELALAAGVPGLASQRIATAFAGTQLAAAFAGPATAAGRLEQDVLRARIAALRDAARLDPLGPAPALRFALALRAQVRDLQRIVWGVALAAPRATVAAGLVTA